MGERAEETKHLSEGRKNLFVRDCVLRAHVRRRRAASVHYR